MKRSENKFGENDIFSSRYNGVLDYKGTAKRHRTKMSLIRRENQGNGIKKIGSEQVSTQAKDCPSVLDGNRHVVSYTYSKYNTILVEYAHDPMKDMFQIGRSSEDQIDFTIVDTWLASASGGSNSPHQSASNSAKNNHNSKHDDKRLSSTISRYACRIIIDRESSSKAYLYAAGFDTRKNIFLGEKATKWQKKNGDMDGLTTNGVLILHPTRDDDEEGIPPMYMWREVSVDGDIYTLREARSSSIRGRLVMEETNMLQDGSLIDLCGATLLWRTADGLTASPTTAELESALDRLNAGKPQCPVNLNTLIIPKKKSTGATSRQPYAYLRCGHVQGKHDWGLQSTQQGQMLFKCPICLLESERVLQLTMGMECAFHLDSGSLDHAFNPCGHVASLKTVRYWSRIPLPHGTSSFHPVCPFCSVQLASEKPFVRLIFQDHCYDA
ncbi:hypothetical protein WR25_15929 [Diploscapter pachys]|uniref:Pellino n=1 Tax=Diploscapter pachys TaxID=2018661 RepID=A0A2A2JM44_9BILA|nr:hypothetical protein WR25_15929 [Diploscapter pachys]